MQGIIWKHGSYLHSSQQMWRQCQLNFSLHGTVQQWHHIKHDSLLFSCRSEVPLPIQIWETSLKCLTAPLCLLAGCPPCVCHSCELRGSCWWWCYNLPGSLCELKSRSPGPARAAGATAAHVNVNSGWGILSVFMTLCCLNLSDSLKPRQASDYFLNHAVYGVELEIYSIAKYLSI